MVEYKQCTLAWDDGANVLHTVEIIPSVFAILGNSIEIRNARGAWMPWIIINVNPTPIEPTTQNIINYRKG
jgi:hypothetical protein